MSDAANLTPDELRRVIRALNAAVGETDAGTPERFELYHVRNAYKARLYFMENPISKNETQKGINEKD